MTPAICYRRPPHGAAYDSPAIYLPWTKFCLKGQGANAQQVCFTGKDGRIGSRAEAGKMTARAGCASVQRRYARPIAAIAILLEHLGDLRVAYRLA